MLKYFSLLLLVAFTYSPICSSQELSIIKTDHVFVLNQANKQLAPTDLDIYWIIDRNKKQIRIVKDRSVDVVKLDELHSGKKTECGYSTKNYGSDHIEVKGFIITYILNTESEKLCFVRLHSIAEKEKVFYICEKKNEELLHKWVKCRH